MLKSASAWSIFINDRVDPLSIIAWMTDISLVLMSGPVIYWVCINSLFHRESLPFSHQMQCHALYPWRIDYLIFLCRIISKECSEIPILNQYVLTLSIFILDYLPCLPSLEYSWSSFSSPVNTSEFHQAWLWKTSVHVFVPLSLSLYRHLRWPLKMFLDNLDTIHDSAITILYTED